MEKGPEIRIIGGASIEKKEQAKKEIEQALFNHFKSLSPEEQKSLKKFEYQKSKKEIALIGFANKETSQLMREAGREPYDVPEENLHIISQKLYEKISNPNTMAATFYTKQGIIFNKRYFENNFLSFGITVLHEILHLKSSLSLEVNEENGKIKKTFYRRGVLVAALQKYLDQRKNHEHFSGLNEAIISETEKRLLNKILDCPELVIEKEWLASEEAKEIKKKLAEEKGISKDEIIISRKGKNNWGVISYPQQRNVLNYLCVEIQKQFPDQFQNSDEVYKVFLNAHFTGRLLSIGRFVEKTFGEGSFRMLGNMNTDDESGVLHLESLKKARWRQIRK